jgi:hypothetical protein
MEQQIVPEPEKLKDTVREKKIPVTIDAKELAAPITAQQSLVKPVNKDTSAAAIRITENQGSQSKKSEIPIVNPKKPDTTSSSSKITKPESLPVKPVIPVLKMKPTDTTAKQKIKQLPEPTRPAPVVSPQQLAEKLIIADSCDFALQTRAGYTLAAALTAQKSIADTFGRPVMIISEGGICKVRFSGLCGRKEAEVFQLKLAGMGFSDTYILQIRGYSIQVGAFRVRAYALEAQARLVDSFSRPILIVFEDGYYKVRITGFIRFTDAKKFLPVLNDHGFPDTYLMKSH